MKKRVALVTGGTGGIGSAICRELAGLGHTVVSGYYPPEKESAEAWQQRKLGKGFSIAVAPIDVSSFEDCERAVNAITDEFGPVEILVNCAGITRDGTLKKMSEENWQAVMSTNLDSVFHVTRHVINDMLATAGAVSSMWHRSTASADSSVRPITRLPRRACMALRWRWRWRRRPRVLRSIPFRQAMSRRL